MTKKQKKLYIDILVKNRGLLKRVMENVIITFLPESIRSDFSLNNQLMHLRKAVAHPYLFPGTVISDMYGRQLLIVGQEPEPFTEGEHIVTASEKMRVSH